MANQVSLINRLSSSQYLRESCFYVGLQQVTQICVSVSQVWVLAHYLPRESYGIWGYAAALAALASVFTLPGITRVITYGAAREQDGVLMAGVKLRLFFGFLTSGALLVMAVGHNLSARQDAAAILLFAGLFMPAQQAFDSMEAFLTGQGKFRVIFFRRLVAQSTLVTALWLGALGTGSVVVCGAILYGGGFLVSGILFLVLLKYRRNTDLPENFRSMTIQFSLQSIGTTISRSVERPLLSALVGFHELAAYNLALAAQFPVSFGRLADRILISRLARPQSSFLVSDIVRSMGLSFAIGWPAYLFMTSVVSLVVPLLLPKYGDAVPIIRILLLQIPFAWGAKPGMSWLMAHPGNHHWYHGLVWGTIIFRIVFITAGAFLDGVIGVAWGWVAVEFLSFFMILIVLLFKKGRSSNE